MNNSKLKIKNANSRPASSVSVSRKRPAPGEFLIFDSEYLIPPSRRAFTLVELLVVIAIIAILAALSVGVTGVATAKMRESRVASELGMLQTVIENYKLRVGSYPPDHRNVTSTDPVVRSNALARPPLFQELTGMNILFENNATFYVTINGERTTPAEVNSFFGRQGFLNASVERSEVQNFFPNIRPEHYAKAAPNIDLLVVPVQGGSEMPVAGSPGTTLNTWRYNSTNPTYNPGTYDLWAEILIRGQPVVIGNWKD
jgi:prepilin-type N-terminal cleavage/methylation domain-containing protein